MKITMLGTLPPIIGISPYCVHLANSLSKLTDLDFLDFKSFSKKSTKFDRETKIDEEFYIGILNKFNTRKTLIWGNPLSGLKAGFKLDGDILHIQWWICTLIFICFPLVVMAKLKKIKIVFSIHNVLPHEKTKKNIFLDYFANRCIFPFVDAFILHNAKNKQNFIDLYSIDKSKIAIITHGTFDLIKKKDISKNDARKYLNLSSEKKIILFFGYIRPYKGIDVLLKSFSKIKTKIENSFLLIVGQVWNDTWENYDVFIKKGNLDIKDIRVELGFIPENEVQYYFQASDVVVLPYKHLDTHGGVGALALSFKKPLIVTDVGGSSEYIIDKRMLVRPDDVDDLYQKLYLALSDEHMLNKMKNDSEELSKEITWDKVAEKTLDFYKDLLVSS
jgi:glycosyltransferase involved in cell wall biosynthesis